MLTPDQLTGQQKQAYEAQCCLAKKIFSVGMHDISNEDYHCSAGISRSGISKFKEDPLYYWGEYINPKKPRAKEEKKRSLELGNAVHCYLLENEKFNDCYTVIPKFSGKGSKKCKQEFIAEHNGKILLDQNDLEIIKATAGAVREHPDASLFLGEDSLVEKSFFWIDEDTGLLCKARPDIILGNLTIDLKTTDKAPKKWFSRSIHNYDYHIQAAMILDAQKAVTGTEPQVFLFIACEPKYPYLVKVYPLGQPSIDKGREEYKNELLKAQRYFISNQWRSIGKDMEEIDIPNYAFY